MLNFSALLNPAFAPILQQIPLHKLAMLKPLLRHEKFETFTNEDFALLGQALDVRVAVTEELKSAALEFLRGQSIDKVAELIQSPESLQQLITFFKGGVATLRISNESQTPLNAEKRRGLWDCEACGTCNPVEFEPSELPLRLTCSACPQIHIIEE